MTIDYRSIPEVQQALNKLESMRQSEDAWTAHVGRTLLHNVGDVFWLAVKVSDPELAQLVLLSLFYNPFSINLPGLQLIGTSLPGDREKQAVKQWLQDRLRELS